MRRLLIAIAVGFLWASPALAKPKVAVTPVTGDSDDKMGAAVRESLDGKLSVLGPEEVERAMGKLSLSGELEEGDVQRLRTRLDAAIVVQGKISRTGQKRSVKLVVWVRGKKPSDFNVQYKTEASDKFREAVGDALLKRIGPLSELEDEEKEKEKEKPKKRLTDGDEEKPGKKKKIAEGDEEKPKKRLTDGDEEKPGKKKKIAEGDEEKPKKRLTDGDEEKPKKRLTDGDEEKPGKKKKVAEGDEEKPKKKVAEGDEGDEEKPKKKKVAEGDEGDEEKPKKKKVAEGDEEKPKKKKIATADGDDRPKVRKRKRGAGGDGEGVQEQPAAPLPAVRVDAGVAYAARYLTFAAAADSTKKPPKLLTPAAALRIEAELYPLALLNRSSALAGLGIFGEYGKTFGLSIDIPDVKDTTAPIDQAHFEIGALYRIAFGKSSVAFGVAYASRHYIADRTTLLMPTQLDTPDVDYAGVAPRLGVRTQATSSVALFAEAGGMLVLSAGGITATPSYGAGDVYGLGGNAGIDIAFTKQIGLRVTGEYSQINLSFKGTGVMASQRKVTAATDRDFGMSGTLAAWF